jgi:hypothetical protein
MPKNDELGLKGQGVEPLEIPEIDKAIAKYQRKKEARCAESPGELAAKKDLQAVLHAHREELPVDETGVPYYRSDGRDYILEEKLRVKKVETATDED